MTTPQIPSPVSVRDITNDEATLQYHAIDSGSLDGRRVFLATWNDRCAWYELSTDGQFCAAVYNESECFTSHEAAQTWCYSRVEVTA